MLKPLPREFYLRDTTEVAKDLLGKVIARKYKNTFLTGKIVEVEAYIGSHDPACHAYKKTKGRCEVMYLIGGTAYVYFVYGNHYCFNIVTGKEGEGNAVLIRAVEPIKGLEFIRSQRGRDKSIYDLTNGPGKFCEAFQINLKDNGKDLVNDKCFFISLNNLPGYSKQVIMQSVRIGINKGKEFPYRFFILNNPFVSKHKLNETAVKI